jgi:hypothetical protein
MTDGIGHVLYLFLVERCKAVQSTKHTLMGS